ncbi:MAG: hypothetical protein SF162_06000 [bacterium]|nr:hypothetical protein [bacterium]
MSNLLTVHTLKAHAVILRDADQEVLATAHDAGIGTFLGLPDAWVPPPNTPRLMLAAKLRDQFGIETAVERLLAVDMMAFDWYRGKSTLPLRREMRTDLAFLCRLKTSDAPRIVDAALLDDTTIARIGWVYVPQFAHDMQSRARDFWVRAIRAAQTGETAELVEYPLEDVEY